MNRLGKIILLVYFGLILILPLGYIVYAYYSRELFFVSILLFLSWIIIFYLVYEHVQVKRPIQNALQLIGLAGTTGDLKDQIKQFAEEFLRFHRTVNAFRNDPASKPQNLNAKLRRIAKLVYKEFKANAVEIALFDEVSQKWSQGMVLGSPRSLDCQGMFNEIKEARDKKVLSYGNYQMVAAPMILAGVVYGVLRVEIPTSNRPSKNDAELINLFATQGALALMDAKFNSELLRLRFANEETVKAKTGFLANLSHEIRGPLGTILNGTELMLNGLCGAVTEDQNSILKMLQGSSRHLLDLVNDVLDYAKVEAGKVIVNKAELPVYELLDDLLTTLRPQAQNKEQTLELIDFDKNIAVVCDRRHARQIMINLITNSIKYTPDKGEIKVFVEEEESAIKIIIEDNGIGIPEDQRDKVFSAFERVEDKYAQTQNGTGLGMPLARKLALINQGDLDFSSEVGKGSNFWLTLPKTELKITIPKEQEETKSVTIQGNGEQILIIDHDQSSVKVLSTYLSSQGFKILTTKNKNEIRSYIEKKKFDLVVIENDFPDLPGEEILGLLKSSEKTNRVPIILLSAKAFVFDIERFLKLGADRCLSKPFELKEMAFTIRQLIDQFKELN